MPPAQSLASCRVCGKGLPIVSGVVSVREPAINVKLARVRGTSNECVAPWEQKCETLHHTDITWAPRDSNHRRFDGLFNSLFGLPLNIKALHCFCDEIYHWPVVSLHTWPVMRKAVPFNVVSVARNPNHKGCPITVNQMSNPSGWCPGFTGPMILSAQVHWGLNRMVAAKQMVF